MVLCILNRTDICFSIDKVKLISKKKKKVKKKNKKKTKQCEAIFPRAFNLALYMAARAEKRSAHGL